MDHVLDAYRHITVRGTPMPSPPRWRYLTRSYVEWARLPLIPIAKARDQAVVGMLRFDSSSPLPGAGQQSATGGVRHENRLYERESDGLAYVLLPGRTLP